MAARCQWELRSGGSKPSLAQKLRAVGVLAPWKLPMAAGPGGATRESGGWLFRVLGSLILHSGLGSAR